MLKSALLVFAAIYIGSAAMVFITFLYVFARDRTMPDTLDCHDAFWMAAIPGLNTIMAVLAIHLLYVDAREWLRKLAGAE